MKTPDFMSSSKKIKLIVLCILFCLQMHAQEAEYCAVCSRQAWEGDSAALNKFIAGCGIIDTVNYDASGKPAKTNKKMYQTVTMKLNNGKVMFTDSIYFIADKMPQFNGGDTALVKYLSKNVHYPAGEKNIAGSVYISFIVEKDGSVKHARIIRGIGEIFDKEALQVINNMPPWQPGTKQGRTVRVQMNIPVKFKLR
jgi:TonB family protein